MRKVLLQGMEVNNPLPRETTENHFCNEFLCLYNSGTNVIMITFAEEHPTELSLSFLRSRLIFLANFAFL